MFSYGVYQSLPAGKANLTINYGEEDDLAVVNADTSYTPVIGAGFTLHQFRVDSDNSNDLVDVKVVAKSSLAPATSPVYLQVYNTLTNLWETLISNSSATANTDFNLSYTLSSNQQSYFDSNYEIAFRIYQYGEPDHTLSVNQFCCHFVISYSSVYSTQNSVYDSTYTTQNTAYSDSYTDQNTPYADKYESKLERCS